MAFDQHFNFGFTTVAVAPVTPTGGLALTLTSAATFTGAPPYNCTVWPAGTVPLATNAEIVRVTALVGAVATIVRTAEPGGINRAILVGDQIAQTITAKVITDIEALVPTTPAAPDTSVQFNDAGAFGGIAGFTFTKDGASGLVTLSGAGSGDFDGYKALLNIVRTGGEQGLVLTNSITGDDAFSALYVSADASFFIEADENGDDATFAYLTASHTWKFYDPLLLGSDLTLDNAKAIKTDTTTAHTVLLQAYDVDGATYSTFATLTNGNTPSLTIAEPAGGTLLIKPPTSDPHVAGALWNNSGLAVISAG